MRGEIAFVMLLWLGVGTLALNNGLGLTPQMGYSSWMDTSSNVTEGRIKYIAELLVSTGLAKLGYTYVNVDEGWLKGRYPNGNIIIIPFNFLTSLFIFLLRSIVIILSHLLLPLLSFSLARLISFNFLISFTYATIYWDEEKFPNGMKALGDYIHSLGLKYGLYTCRGSCQCSTSQYSGPGSLGYEKQDAEIMVSWGMDYLKEDSCCGSQDHDTAFAQYGLMRDALNATGRPVFFSLCGWNSWYAPVGYSLGNSWRIAGDGDNWPALTNCINVIAQVYNYSGPGGWSDPDLLLGTGIGSYGPDRSGWYQTDLQSRSQFTMWCIFPAPLLISAEYALETWSNAEAIAVHQDMGRYPQFPHGAWRVVGEDLQANSGTNIWGRALSNGDFAVAFLNNFPSAQNITCDQSCFAQMKFSPSAALTIRDLWAHKDVGTISPYSFTATYVPGNGGVAFFRFIL